MSAQRPYDVLVVGELNVDIIVSGDVVPQFGQVEKLVDDVTVCAGASGAIFAACASRMGLRVLYCSVVGPDPFGHFMIEALRDVGVDTSHVRIDETIKTGVGIQLSTGHDRAMLTYLGSIAAVSAMDVPAHFYRLARHLHVVSPFLLTGLRSAMPEIMRAAREKGMTVSLDTNWDPSESWEIGDLLEHVDLFLPNENELKAIAQCPDLIKASQIIKQRIPTLAIKRGSLGAMAVCANERASLPALKVDVVDTTGAGDSFDGGFLAGWLRGEPLEMCLALGVVCGSLTTTAVGGFNGQPTWDVAARLARQLLSH